VPDALGKFRAIIGGKIPDGDKVAQGAIEKLDGGKERPTPTELVALELAIRLMRPAPLSRNGTLDSLPSAKGSSLYQPEVTTAWEEFRAIVRPFLYSVGRLDRADGAAAGTGFLVAADLVLTNHHVVSQLSDGADELDDTMASIRFYQEFSGPEPFPSCPVVEVVEIHPKLDLALLRIKVPDARPALAFEATSLPADELIAAIGYPFKDGRNPLFVDAIYQGAYGVKRAAIGEIMCTEEHSLYHDCSTLGGNSGSPIVALSTGRVVGVHFTGEFMYRNEAVTAADAAEFVHGVTK
jgi:S1-C subfamily serine protease